VDDVSRQEAAGPVVAIIGGGASGALAAIALLQSSASWRYPVRIVMIDQYGRHGLGQAYSTAHPDHLLNAPADQMSAVADDPKHLIRWADATGVDPTGFMRRRDYGKYLRQTLADAARDAASLASFTPVTGEVVAIRPGGAGLCGQTLAVLTRAGGEFLADLVFLATGSLPPAFPFEVPGSGRVIADPWAPEALDRVADGSDVLVVGTGLTALDLVLTVTGGNADATVHAVSRHGLLPRPHLQDRPPEAVVRLPEFKIGPGEVRLREVVAYVRRAAAADGYAWQDVMDSLRTQVPALWHSMPASDQRVFLSRLARFWEVHRHRVPQATGARIDGLRRSGRLVVHRGRVSGVTEQGGGLRALITDGEGTTELEVGWLLNGTGQGTDAARTADPLLRDLFDSGLARPDPLGLGIAAAADGAVLDRSGTPSTELFALGPPLRGLWYETTAIPEIRQQAAALSEVVAARAAGEWSRR
jgi:uncharacterized NAD(P)/FAD-binding protein YdhS